MTDTAIKLLRLLSQILLSSEDYHFRTLISMFVLKSDEWWICGRCSHVQVWSQPGNVFEIDYMVLLIHYSLISSLSATNVINCMQAFSVYRIFVFVLSAFSLNIFLTYCWQKQVRRPNICPNYSGFNIPNSMGIGACYVTSHVLEMLISETFRNNIWLPLNAIQILRSCRLSVNVASTKTISKMMSISNQICAKMYWF